jgi:cysteinyl-tRNA synthetase
MTLHFPQLPHVGQVRAAVCLDVMIRWLLASMAQPAQIQPSAGLACFGLVSPVVPLAKALSVVRPQELRYYLLAEAHYRKAIAYTDQAAEDAAVRYQQIERFVAKASGVLIPEQGSGPEQASGLEPASGPEQASGPGPASGPEQASGLGPASGLEPASGLGPASGPEQASGLGPADGPSPRRQKEPSSPADLPFSFAAALDDDLSIPTALASVHATVHDGNYAISSGDRDAVATSLAQVRSMLGVLGLDPLNPYWAAARSGDRPDSADPRDRVIDALVRLALRQRDASRGRGDYASADSISDTLEGTGIEVVDTSAGPQWELKR